MPSDLWVVEEVTQLPEKYCMKYPTLKYVAVSPGETGSVSAFLCGLKCVESLDVLDSLPSSPFSDTHPFPVLRKLYLSAPGIELVTRFLGWCTKLPLTSFEAYFTSFLTGAETHDLFTALAERVASSSLTNLVVFNDYHRLCTPNCVIQSHYIRMLFRFTNLTSITILSPIGIDLDDATVLDLALPVPRRAPLFTHPFILRVLRDRGVSGEPRSGAIILLLTTTVYDPAHQFRMATALLSNAASMVIYEASLALPRQNKWKVPGQRVSSTPLLRGKYSRKAVSLIAAKLLRIALRSFF
ncbi:hypothetical protein B0H11DRAFT_2385712 [Mycena galericulata]|nr:hypothetical protein B0H11DRAFT_2385712 [Mycena galericulata]